MSLPPSSYRAPRLAAALALLLLTVAATHARAQSVEHAKKLWDEQRWVDAKTEFAAVQRADGKNAAAAYYLGRLAMIDNDTDEAIRQLERATELEDNNALYHLYLGSAVGDAAQRASKFKQPFMARRVKKEFERAADLDPNLLDAHWGLMQFYAIAPGFMGGSMEKAREQAALVGRHNAMRGALAMAYVAQREKDATKEEAGYQQAVAAAPDSAAGYLNLAGFYGRTNRWADAWALLDRYAKRRADDRWIPFYVGRLAAQSGQQLDRGDAALQQFLASPPPDAHVANQAAAHYWMGQLAEKRGQKDAARTHYETAVKLNAKNTAAKAALDALK